MAKLIALPHKAIISGLHGVIDYYLHDGVACARAWPKSPGRNRSAPVVAQWPAFTNAAREWTHLSKIVQDAYNKLATNSGLSGRDMQVRAYLTGLYRYPTP